MSSCKSAALPIIACLVFAPSSWASEVFHFTGYTEMSLTSVRSRQERVRPSPRRWVI